MIVVFWIASFVALVATALAVTRANAVHALLYLIVSLLAVAGVFAILGAPLAAALEVIVYAGAIVVLFVFVVTLVVQGPAELAEERALLQPRAWVGPSLLTAALLVLLGWVVTSGDAPATAALPVTAKEVAITLYGPYMVGVEAASFLLLGGLVGAWHVGRGYRRSALPKELPASEPARKAS